MALQITTEQVEGRVPITVVALDGELDASNFERLIEEVRGLYDAGDRTLLLDLSGLTFMASSGLVALHGIVRLMHGDDPRRPREWLGRLPRLDQRRRRRERQAEVQLCGTQPARDTRARADGAGPAVRRPIPIARPRSPRSDATSRSAMTDPGAALDLGASSAILASFAPWATVAVQSRRRRGRPRRSPAPPCSPGDRADASADAVADRCGHPLRGRSRRTRHGRRGRPRPTIAAVVSGARRTGRARPSASTGRGRAPLVGAELAQGPLGAAQLRVSRRAGRARLRPRELLRGGPRDRR